MADAQDLRDEMEELKLAIRTMQKEGKTPFEQSAYDAICRLARQYIREVEPVAAPKEKP